MDNSPVSTAPPGPNHHHLGSIAAQLRPDGQGYVTRSSFATHSDAESAHHSTLDLELRCGEVSSGRSPTS